LSNGNKLKQANNLCRIFAATESGGKAPPASTLPAPIITLSPTIVPFKMIEFVPIKQLLTISTLRRFPTADKSSAELLLI
jgi:hypothetical protein